MLFVHFINHNMFDHNIVFWGDRVCITPRRWNWHRLFSPSPWKTIDRGSTVFHFALNGGPFLVQCTAAVNNRFLLTTFKAGTGNVFLQPTNTWYLMNRLFTAHPSSAGLCKLTHCGRVFFFVKMLFIHSEWDHASINIHQQDHAEKGYIFV